MAPPYHQEKKIVTTRSKLFLLLRRCLTKAPAATVSPRQNLQGQQTHRRIQPLDLSKQRNPYYDGLTLLTAQEQAIQRWELPRRPEYRR